MVFNLLKKNREKSDENVAEDSDAHHILILEDDPDQMDLLVNFALTEMRKLLDDKNTTKQQKTKLSKIKVISASSIESLTSAVKNNGHILLALLDCNIPDAKGGKSHDQFIKVNHSITGKHKSVEIVVDHLPDTPITMISTLDRFQKITHKYYINKYSLDINFISKKDLQMIKRNVGYYLRQYLKDEAPI